MRRISAAISVDPADVAADLTVSGAPALVDHEEAGAPVRRAVEARRRCVRGPAAHATHRARTTDRRVRGISGQHGLTVVPFRDASSRMKGIRSARRSVWWIAALFGLARRG